MNLPWAAQFSTHLHIWTASMRLPFYFQRCRRTQCAHESARFRHTSSWPASMWKKKNRRVAQNVAQKSTKRRKLSLLMEEMEDYSQGLIISTWSTSAAYYSRVHHRFRSRDCFHIQFEPRDSVFFFLFLLTVNLGKWVKAKTIDVQHINTRRPTKSYRRWDLNSQTTTALSFDLSILLSRNQNVPLAIRRSPVSSR